MGKTLFTNLEPGTINGSVEHLPECRHSPLEVALPKIPIFPVGEWKNLHILALIAPSAGLIMMILVFNEPDQWSGYYPRITRDIHQIIRMPDFDAIPA